MNSVDLSSVFANLNMGMAENSQEIEDQDQKQHEFFGSEFDGSESSYSAMTLPSTNPQQMTGSYEQILCWYLQIGLGAYTKRLVRPTSSATFIHRSSFNISLVYYNIYPISIILTRNEWIVNTAAASLTL